MAVPVLARFHGLPIPEDRYRDPALPPEAVRKRTLALLVEYGGLDKASAGKATDYYTNDYLP